MGSLWSSTFPPAAELTEKNLPDQTGKVFIVTGSSSGVGEQLAQILYQHNAKVYVAARSLEKASKAIDGIKSRHPESKGQLVFLHLDLNDLSSIKKSAEDFLSQEDRLDVLWNNAGVMAPPKGSKTAQGFDLQFGTNNLAPFLFTKQLLPTLAETAKSAPTDSVRVVWVSSTAAILAPKPPINFDKMDYNKDIVWSKYSRSKAGNVLHSCELARRIKGNGVISVSLNPGNLKTGLQRHVPKWQKLTFNWLLFEPIYGAYTELFAGLSPKVTTANNGGWIQAWGRIEPGRKDLHEPELGRKFWEWSEEQVKPYE